ncbi:hypothetical protein ACLTEW_15280 [Gordonia lacunae]|uniref:hypothetical protein n=1 Tax=Gordonia lacunae TaxID=417102 RepID=UPI0039E33A72
MSDDDATGGNESQPTNPAEAEQRRQEKKHERRFAGAIAIISAVAALFGAAVGGFFTVSAAHVQSQRDTDIAMLEMRREEFSEFLTTHSDLMAAYENMFRGFEAYARTRDIKALQVQIDAYNVSHRASARTNYVVSLVDTVETDHKRGDFTRKTNEVEAGITNTITQVVGRGLTPSAEQVGKLRALRDEARVLFIKFTNGMQSDMVPPERSVWTVMFGTAPPSPSTREN